MKKFYSLVSVVLMGTAVTFGQATSVVPTHKSKATPSNERKVPALKSNSARHANPNHTQSIVWSDDFSNASNWTISNEVGNTDDWVIGTNIPSGSYAIPGITSTSAANGFALYDSDLMCSNNQIGDLTTATPINCTGHSAVRLVFEEYYRRFFDSTNVLISTDGTTWTSFPVNESMVNNDFCGGTGLGTNPTVVSINISSVAGNQAQVWVRFQFYSPSTLNAAAGCAYSWMIDDAYIEDLPADDIAMVPSFVSPYTIIPLAQAQDIDLAAMVANVGGGAETNVGFTANVYLNQGAGYTQVFNGSSATAANLNSGDTTVSLSAGLFPISDTGVYAFQFISFMTNADADNSNDTILSFLIVGDSTYARDFQPITGSLDNFYGAPATATVSFGNMYDIYTPTTMKSVSIIHAFATLGGQIRADVYDVVGGLPNAVIASSLGYAYTADDTSTQFYFELTIPLITPIALNAGQVFVAIAQLDPSGTNGEFNMGLGFTNNIFTPGTSFIQVNTDPFSSNEDQGLAGAWAIRPNFDLSDAVTETEFAKGISVFPNPSSGKLYIHNSGQKDNMIVTVYNSVGQSVYTGSFSQMANAVVDLSKEAAGVYSVQIKSDKDITTKSVVISNK